MSSICKEMPSYQHLKLFQQVERIKISEDVIRLYEMLIPTPILSLWY